MSARHPCARSSRKVKFITLRGRGDHDHSGCSHADLLAHVRSVEPGSEKQVGSYLKILNERYRMVERLQPVFARPNARNGRFYIRDNFLRSWLGALAVPVASTSFRPVDTLVASADARLQGVEGHGLERLVATLYEERSRKGVGDFPLTEATRGWWDRSDTELDLVAQDSERKVLRLGTCKRSADRLIRDLGQFEGHVGRFLAHSGRFAGWSIEKVAIAPTLDPEQRQACVRAGCLPQDLRDLTDGLLP